MNSKKLSLIKKGRYEPIIFSGWPIDNRLYNKKYKHSRFHKDTHTDTIVIASEGIGRNCIYTESLDITNI